MLTILHVVGARPNYMKVAPIMLEMSHFPESFQQVMVHTGQHYDHEMSRVFFEDLDLPQPDAYLGVGSGRQAEQTAKIMLSFEPVLTDLQPDWVVVVGDVNSTLACALTAAKLGIRVAHVEAGLRSFDRTMPEEINRILTDQISDLLFTTEPSGNENLQREGIPQERIRFVGNVMIDSLTRLLPQARRRPILQELGLRQRNGHPRSLKKERIASPPGFVLVTLHRPCNVDRVPVLREILAALEDIARDLPVVFSVHPRTRKQIDEHLLRPLCPDVRFLPPLGYLDFMALMQAASVVITDSGGLQEETTYLGVPCLTVRPNTERPITLTLGTNRLVASRQEELCKAAREAIQRGTHGANSPPELWDGEAAKRIVAELRQP